jgi:signal transduction histidine kinase
MRDMVDGEGGYPLGAWRSEFDRIREDLKDAISIEGKLATHPPEQQRYLIDSMNQFWISAAQVFNIANEGDAVRARKMIANSLQAQQAAMSSTVARLLVQNNEGEEQALAAVQKIYSGVEGNIYLFMIAMLALIAGTSLALIYSNRRIFDQLATLSEQKSTLARKLIGVQEDVLRSVSRELHDDFGQILTAIGVMLGRAERIARRFATSS